MNDHEASAGLGDQLAQAHSDVRQLEALLARLMEALSANGFNVAVNLADLSGVTAKRLESVVSQAVALERQVEHMRGLLRTFSMITSSLELSDVLSEVMDTVIALTGAERACLVLRDPRTGQLETAVARNWESESLSESEIGFSRSVINRVMNEGQPVITTNAAVDDRFQDAKSVVMQRLRSILCIPLTLRGQCEGVLYADNRLSQNLYRSETIPLLTAFGTQAAIAIENARQYGRVREDLSRALDELHSLRIEIDRSRLERQVTQITDTEYFQRLAESARVMRGRVGRDTTSADTA